MGNRSVKQDLIDQIKDNICRSNVAIVTDYRGLTVEEITTLRRNLQEKNAEYTVVKNTLARIAVKDTEFEPLSQFLKGPTALVLGHGDQVEPAKILSQFIKKAKKVTVRGGLLDGAVLNDKQVKQLAEMPSKNELYSKMLGSLSSPASGLAVTLNGVARSLAVVINEMAKKENA
jgi:large subunit ribosomal protein L10